MSGREDLCWEEVVEALDLEAGDLLAAEQRLLSGGSDPLPPAAVDAIVARTTGMAPVRMMPAAKQDNLAKVAAILIGALLLAAAGSAYLVWHSGANSDETMTYPMAIDILQRPEQPIDHQRAALKTARGRVLYAIEVMQRTRDDQSVPSLLRDVSRLRLEYLRDLLDAQSAYEPPPVDDTVLEAGSAVQQSSLHATERLRCLERLVSLAASGMLAIKGTGHVSDDVDRDIAIVVEQMRVQTRR